MSLLRNIFLACIFASTVAYGMDSSSDDEGQRSGEKVQYSVVLNYAWKKIAGEQFPRVERMFDFLQLQVETFETQLERLEAQLEHLEDPGPSQADGTHTLPIASHIRSIKNEREVVFGVLENKWRDHPDYNEQSLCRDPRFRAKFRHMVGKGKASRNDGAPEDKNYQPLMMEYGFNWLNAEQWSVVEGLYDGAVGIEQIAIFRILATKWNECPYSDGFRTIFDCPKFAGRKQLFDDGSAGSQARGHLEFLNIALEPVKWKKVGGLTCLLAALVWYAWYSYKDLFDDEEELIELDEFIPADKDDVKQENNNALHQQSYPV